MWERLEGRGDHPVGWRKENRLDRGSAGCLSLQWGESRGEGKVTCESSRQMRLHFICGWGGRVEEEPVNHGSFL